MQGTSPKSRKDYRAPRGPAIIALAYLTIGALWILFSDRLVASLAQDPATLVWLQTYKGWFYVLTTAILFYIMIAAYVGRIRRLQANQWESASRYQTLFDASPDALFLLDSQGRLLDANRAALEGYGYTRDELLRMTARDLAAPELQHQTPARIQQALETGAQFEWRHRRKDGSEFPVEIRAQGFRLAGQPCILSSVRDITEQRRAEQALRDSEAKLRTVFHSSADLITLADIETGVYLDANQGFLETTGYTREEVIGKTGEALGLWCDPARRHEIMRRLSQGEEVRNEEIAFHKKDGTTFVALLTAEIVQIGGCSCLLCMARDITELKRMEQALRESEWRFRALFEHMPSGAVVYTAVDDGADFVIKEFNSAAERIEGVRREDVVGKRVTEAFPGVEEFGLLRIFREVWQSGNEAFYPEAAYTDETGRKTWRENWVYKLPNGDIVAIYNDVTERKRAEEKIRESEETYRNLFQNAQVGLYRTRIEDGKILESNEQLARMFGYDSREEFIREYITSQNYVDPGTRERMLEQLRRDGHIQNFEARFYRKDRSIFWARYSARIYPDKGWIEGVAEDITEEKQAEETLRRRTEELSVLNRLGLALAQTLDLSRVYDIAREHVSRLVDAPVFGISLYDPETRTLRAEAMWSDGAALDASRFPPLRMPEDAREATHGRAKAILTGEPEVVESLPDAIAQTSEKPHRINPPGVEREALTAIYVPMMVESRVIGLLEAQSYRPGAYGENDVGLLRPVANQIGLAIQNARLFRQVRQHAAELEQSLADLKQAQEALRASEARFRGLVESMDDIIFTLDREGRHTGVFGRWLERYGTPPEMYLGKTAREIMGPEAARVHEEANARALAGANVVYEWSAPGADGLLYFQTSLSPLFGRDGQIVGIVGVGRDITARRRAEEALRESEATLRSIFNAAPIGMGLVRDRVLLQVNETLCEMLGYAPEELVGQSARILYETEAEFQRVGTEKYAQIREHGVGTAETRFRCKDGTLRDIWLSSVAIDPADLSKGVTFTAMDITDRKRMEQALRESEARYRSLVNLSPDGMWVHRGGQVLFTNAAMAAMLGAASPDDLIGKQVLDFVAPEYRGIVVERIRRGQEERLPAPLLEEKLLRVDGSEFWAEVCAVPIDWAGGPAVQVIVHDITDRKHMEERLLQAQKMEVVGRLAGGIAHDFNNILTAMTGYATFVLEALPPGAPEREDVQQILDLTQRAANLTSQLLAFSRRQIMEQRVINLNDLILNLDKMLRRLIGEDIELVVLPGEDLARVKADAGQIEQVIVNLAVNARDAMPEGGKLIIQTANVTVDEELERTHPGLESGAYVMLSVTDTGVGMTDKVKAHLFEPFFTTKEPGKGTGLGLATAYGIVKQHGGNIYADSEPGKGTTFTIYLPAVEAEAERLPRRDEAGFIPGGKETVLVVEDEALVRAIVVRTLKEQGYRVLEAESGEEALRIAQEHAGEIDLLLTDVVMPQMGGKELSERVAAIHPRIKTLFISGYTDNAIVHRGILNPGIAFLHKPFTAAALTRKVRQVLDMD